MHETKVTIAGNLGADPELSVAASGKATARMRVAVTPRRRDGAGEWADGDTSWHTVIAWGALAEHAAEQLGKGARVIVHGRLAERAFESKDGQARTVWEITAEEIGTTLRAGTGGASASWQAQPDAAAAGPVQEQRRTHSNGNRWAHAAKH